MTLAIAHLDGTRVVLDAIRERTAPFEPDGVVQEFAALLKSYRVGTVTGDKYAGEWLTERFRAHGITYRAAGMTKSELYLACLPRLNSGTIDLLDHDKLVKQLVGLEERRGRRAAAGKRSITRRAVTTMCATPSRASRSWRVSRRRALGLRWWGNGYDTDPAFEDLPEG